MRKKSLALGFLLGFFFTVCLGAAMNTGGVAFPGSAVVDVGTGEYRAGSALGTSTVGWARTAQDQWLATDASSGKVAVIASSSVGVLCLISTASMATTSADPPVPVITGSSTHVLLNEFAINPDVAGVGIPNALQYIGDRDGEWFEVIVALTAEKSAGPTSEIHYTIGLNGSFIEGSEQHRDHSSADTGSVTITWTLQLDTDDYIQVFVDSTASDPTIDFEHITMTVRRSN